MDISAALKKASESDLRRELERFLTDFTTPAFGALPKREAELRVFELMRSLGVLDVEANVYTLMTELKVTRTKASQLIFDLEIRTHGGDTKRLDALVKEALINTRFTKDGDYFVMEIENPLTLAHMRDKIREIGHFSDTSFNASLVRAPLDTVTDLILELLSDKDQAAIEAALVRAGAPGKGAKAVIKGALKTLGKKVVGEAADQMAESVVENSADFLKPILDVQLGAIKTHWHKLFHSDKKDGQ